MSLIKAGAERRTGAPLLEAGAERRTAAPLFEAGAERRTGAPLFEAGAERRTGAPYSKERIGALARRVGFGTLLFLFGSLTPGVIRAAGFTPFQVVDGDGWLTSNASHTTGEWSPFNASRPSFGLQLSLRNDIPFENGTAGATFWVRRPGCTSFASYGRPCGWQLGLAVTQFRSIVVGGNGIEIDGLDAGTPYGRVINASNGEGRLIGLLTNAYADLSGIDTPNAPSWFAGFDLSNDTFAVRRSAKIPHASDDLLAIDRQGVVRASGGIEAPRALQRSAAQWATRAHLAGGRYTFKYGASFANPPVCIATSEGTARLRVTPTATSCTITSDDPADAAMIDVVVVGNPS
jgi:hypothetical protein